MSTTHVAIYARVSSEQQAAAQTIASQLTALQQRVLAEGFALPDALQFIDEGYSGRRWSARLWSACATW